ncbi:MAG TPA: 50S ribosomal protein L10 [Flavobacteriales bacterium]|nr:50S ribosomal protein L10 [Flavobacteriales bacterium]|tara:strand:+ start:1370 stop:1891 length:522 start_codon:yes stop_codon:yes gene_type:complete
MTKEQKNEAINQLSEELAGANIFYLADTSELDADSTSKLRRNCFKQDISLKIVKNTLLQKAMEKVEERDFSELYSVLSGPTSIMYSEVGNAPAKIIKEFRKKHDKPVLKAAYIEESIYIGDDKLGSLCDIKSKEELLGEVITLLQSPAKNVVSALQSGKHTIAGLVKTLAERE